MPRLLIVHHTPSPAVQEILDAVRAGAQLPELAEVHVHSEPALSATVSDTLAADAIVLLTPANIGYMSGAMKHYFDTVYYPCLQATRGRPFGLAVHGNDDVTGAVRSVTRITDALGWVACAPILRIVGAPGRDDLARAQELGSVVAANSV